MKSLQGIILGTITALLTICIGSAQYSTAEIVTTITACNKHLTSDNVAVITENISSNLSTLAHPITKEFVESILCALVHTHHFSVPSRYITSLCPICCDNSTQLRGLPCCGYIICINCLLHIYAISINDRARCPHCRDFLFQTKYGSKGLRNFLRTQKTFKRLRAQTIHQALFDNEEQVAADRITAATLLEEDYRTQLAEDAAFAVQLAAQLADEETDDGDEEDEGTEDGYDADEE